MDSDYKGILSFRQESPNLKYKIVSLIIRISLECHKECIAKTAEQKYPQRTNTALHAGRHNRFLPNHHSNLMLRPNLNCNPSRNLTLNLLLKAQECLVKISIP
jgi:hypothetical protein